MKWVDWSDLLTHLLCSLLLRGSAVLNKLSNLELSSFLSFCLTEVKRVSFIHLHAASPSLVLVCCCISLSLVSFSFRFQFVTLRYLHYFTILLQYKTKTTMRFSLTLLGSTRPTQQCESKFNLKIRRPTRTLTELPCQPASSTHTHTNWRHFRMIILRRNISRVRFYTKHTHTCSLTVVKKYCVFVFVYYKPHRHNNNWESKKRVACFSLPVFKLVAGQGSQSVRKRRTKVGLR